MKPRSGWGPADDLAWAVSTGTMLAIGCLFLFAFGYGAADAVANRIKEHAEFVEGNHRGYVRCVDGRIEIGNFDIDALDQSSGPVFNIDNLKCAHSSDAPGIMWEQR